MAKSSGLKTYRTAQQSFGAGIISPELYGRLDQAAYTVGLKEATNFLIMPHGPAVKRAGFEYIIDARNDGQASRLIPWIFNADQAYVLEFGDNTMRIHTEGATVLESNQTITGATSANPIVVTIASHGYSNGDDIYLASLPGDFAALNGRYFAVSNVTTNTFEVSVDGSAFGAYTSGGTAARVYTLATPYGYADLAELRFVQSADTMTLVHPDYAPRELIRSGATSWAFSTITFGPGIDAPTSISATATVGTGSTTYNYTVTAISDDGLEESLAGTANSCTNDLTTAGNYNTITWTASTGAIRYNVYKQRNGLFGYIGQTDATSFIDDNIEADLLTTPPEDQTPFSGAGNYPSAVTYFEQRRCFASTDNAPQSVWMTRPGTASNLSRSIPARDDDAISFTLASRQLNQVQHLLPLADLLLLTNVAEWKVTAQNSDAITPSTIWVRSQGATGSSVLPPIIARDSVLFVQAQGAHFAKMQYSNDKQIYGSEDISVMAPHLFDGFAFTSWAFTRAPQPVVWAVRDDGKLLALTYLPEQEVLAYHLHETDGLFESVAAIPEGNEDRLYAIVQRTINSTTKRYIERLHSRVFDAIENAFYVDCGLVYEGASTDTITGLDHLEGETVTILGDGLVQATKVVSGGSITLDTAVTKAHVGLPYTAQLKTLPLLMQVQGFGQGVKKSCTHAYVRIDESRGVYAGPDTDHLIENAEQHSDLWTGAADTISDVIEIPLDTTWCHDPSLIIQSPDPVPTSVLAISIEVAIGG